MRQFSRRLVRRLPIPGVELRRARLLVILIIVYGCLYPFRFHPFPADPWGIILRSSARRRWTAAPPGTRRSMCCCICPVGCLLSCLWTASGEACAAPAYAITARDVSFHVDRGRSADGLPAESIAFDVLCNTAGRRSDRCGRPMRSNPASWSGQIRMAGAPSAHCCSRCSVSVPVFPLLPSLSLYGVHMQLNSFFGQRSFSALETLRSAIEYLTMGALLERITRAAAYPAVDVRVAAAIAGSDCCCSPSPHVRRGYGRGDRVCLLDFGAQPLAKGGTGFGLASDAQPCAAGTGALQV